MIRRFLASMGILRPAVLRLERAGAAGLVLAWARAGRQPGDPTASARRAYLRWLIERRKSEARVLAFRAKDGEA